MSGIVRTGVIDHALGDGGYNPASRVFVQQGVINHARTTASTTIQVDRQGEMGVVETMLGCGTLLVIAIVVLAILYYLAI